VIPIADETNADELTAILSVEIQGDLMRCDSVQYRLVACAGKPEINEDRTRSLNIVRFIVELFSECDESDDSWANWAKKPEICAAPIFADQ